ncbi:MAG: DUF354 domain-containing protein [Promethearchaeota archaeon]
MKILVNINHPSHVYFYKNIIQQLREAGHEVSITARDKDKTLELLKLMNLEYTLISKCKTSIKDHIFETFERIPKFMKIISKCSPDILISALDPAPAIACRINRIPFICFLDSEPAQLLSKFTLPFINVVFTPNTYRKHLGKKQIKLDTYKEMAYLHPNYFTPNSQTVTDLGLTPDESYVIMRFVSWTAHHDVGQKGIIDKQLFITELSKHCKVYISLEDEGDADLSKYMLKVSPEKIHDVLYYATLFVGDSQTMTTESGILGTPAIRCNSFVGKNDMGNFIELEEKYHLIFNYRDEQSALKKAIEILHNPELGTDRAQRRSKLLKDKINLTDFMVWFIENYPQSLMEIKENLKIEERFK